MTKASRLPRSSLNSNIKMKQQYRINEIFYSLQGEGRWAGRAAVFVRFSGCNLKCPFCDTDFEPKVFMSADEIVQVIKNWSDCGFVVLTGGEPTLQIDGEFIDELHKAGFYVSMETNGTREVPDNIDWVTCSPKSAYTLKGMPLIKKANEVKVVYDGLPEHTPQTYGINADEYYVQPCDVGDETRNKIIMTECVKFVKENPTWKLSLQTQKILNVR